MRLFVVQVPSETSLSELEPLMEAMQLDYGRRPTKLEFKCVDRIAKNWRYTCASRIWQLILVK